MITVILVAHLILAVALILVILSQRTAQDGGGLTGGGGGGGTMGGLFTARGSANLLTRTTAILATLFIITSLLLGWMAGHQHASKSLVDTLVPTTTTEPAPSPQHDPSPAPAETPSAPQVPVSR